MSVAGVAVRGSSRVAGSSLRELIPSFVNTLRRCHSTVRGLMKSCAPISGIREAALGGEPCDLRLLRGEAVASLGAALAHRLTGGHALTAGAFGEPVHADLRIHAAGRPELLTRIHAPTCAAQPLAVEQVCARKRGTHPAGG